MNRGYCIAALRIEEMQMPGVDAETQPLADCDDIPPVQKRTRVRLGAPVGWSIVAKAHDPLQALSDVYYDKVFLKGLQQAEVMKPQSILEFDDAREVVVRWR